MKTIESIIKQYPKTDDCDLQTLGDLHSWQVSELKELFEQQLITLGKELLKQCDNSFIGRIGAGDIIQAFDSVGINLNEKIEF